MALDGYVMDKLASMQRSYKALTERMSDPDVVAAPSLFQAIAQVSAVHPSGRSTVECKRSCFVCVGRNGPS